MLSYNKYIDEVQQSVTTPVDDKDRLLLCIKLLVVNNILYELQRLLV